MLTLIAEIILTVAAWRKGWRWWALLPLLIAGVGSFFTGFAMGSLGYDVLAASPYFILIDVAAIIALICLVATSRYEKAPSFKQLLSQPPRDQQPVNVKRAISSYGDEQL